jgi:CPA1 family monovalent cation:H+ antiporter
MSVFHTIAILISLAALASYVNYRYIKLPQTIGLMAIALFTSIIVTVLGEIDVVKVRELAVFVSSINFGDILLHGLLAFLLFAGAMQVQFSDLKTTKVPVSILATVGVVIASFLTGGLFWFGLKLIGLEIPFVYALLFGALIAPTDPIAVLGIIKKVGAPRILETKIAGESLFNDGTGVVVFLTVLAIVTGQSSPEPKAIILLLLKEVLGGLILGLILGYIIYRLLRSVDAYLVEIPLTLALATGGYTLAELIHVSAPITIVVAGIFIGNHGREYGMSEKTREHLDTFWELVDEILNAILFMLIGLEVIVIALKPIYFVAGFIAIVVSLFGRLISVALPINVMQAINVMKNNEKYMKGTIPLLTWGGLRGGLSIALALSLPNSQERDLIVTTTYAVVVFSILVQGLTFGKLLQFYMKEGNVEEIK